VLGGKDFDRALAELGRPFGWHDSPSTTSTRRSPTSVIWAIAASAPRPSGSRSSPATTATRCARLVEHLIAERRSPFVGSPLTVANEIQPLVRGRCVRRHQHQRHGAE